MLIIVSSYTTFTWDDLKKYMIKKKENNNKILQTVAKFLKQDTNTCANFSADYCKVYACIA